MKPTNQQRSEKKLKKELQKQFSEIIWSAELHNMVLSEYLDTFEGEYTLWIELEKQCKKHNICVWEVAHK